MRIVKIINEEINSLINEEYSDGNLYGYHVTGIKSSETIFKTGFKIGLGAMEGDGLDAFYDLNRAGGYATKDMGERRIIKFKIHDPKRILIVNNLDVAKKIHENNYMIFDQIKNIVGENVLNKLIVDIAKKNMTTPDEYIKMVNNKFLENETNWYVFGNQYSLSNELLKTGDGILHKGAYGQQFLLHNPRSVDLLGYYVVDDLELLPDFHSVNVDSSNFDDDMRINKGTYDY